MKEWSHVNSAAGILNTYPGAEPFAIFTRKYFSLHKKFGSRDRKQISHLCYCYFRLGNLIKERPVEERILSGLFLCSSQSQPILSAIRPQWNEAIGLPVTEKLQVLQSEGTTASLFPFNAGLSHGIDAKQFQLSHLVQPDLFIRVRPGHSKEVLEKLIAAGIDFELKGNDCIALPNTSGIDSVLELDKEVVVQDLSSQHVANLFGALPGSKNLTVWDCCAASGGKSILLFDHDPSIRLTVSDLRESILLNLRSRFRRAGIGQYQSIQLDLSAPVSKKPFSRQFDIIICDAPCSGSGTWGRTPEQLSYFNETAVDTYAGLQRRIISHAIPFLATGGFFLYITCSVFRKENEETVDFCKNEMGLELIQMEVLTGYEQRADTMFAALLRRPL